MSLISEEDGNSTMRVSVLVIVFVISIILLTVAFHIIWQTFKQGNILWLEISAFMGGIGALLTGVLAMKWKQREAEADERVEMKKAEGDTEVEIRKAEGDTKVEMKKAEGDTDVELRKLE